MCKRITPFAIITIALLVCIPSFAQHFLGAFAGSALHIDTQIETPAQNNNAQTLPEQQAGDTIRFQLFAPAGGGHSTNGYTVELDLPGKTFSSYIGTVSGRDWTGAALTSTGSATLSALLLTGGTVPSTGYLGQVDVQVTQPLEDGATLIVKSLVMTSGNDVDQLDVSNAVITFTATSACPGDFDGNGRVDIADFLAFVNVFGSGSSDATYNAQMDLDSSGSVDIADFLSFVNVFGTECEGTPPPTTSNQDSVFTLPRGASLEMVWIELGTFQMGSPDSEPGRKSYEGPVHSVTISQGFYLGKYEVTQGQWESVMGTRPWQGMGSVRSGSDYPAASISWNDTQEFIRRLNASVGSDVYRLPTEAEWEYACRAGTRTRWSFGDDESQLGHYAWYIDNARDVGTGEAYSHIVGTKRANPWGLYDMHGNVREWVQDWYDSNYYSYSPSVDPQGPSSGSDRVLRGGNAGSGAHSVRSARRDYFSPSARTTGGVGFRLALDMGGASGGGRGAINPPNDKVDPGNADALSSVIILPNGTETRQGNPPQPSNTDTAPTISGGISRLTSSNGSTVLIPFTYNTSANLSGCYLYINGAGSYFFLPYTAQSSTSGTLSIPVELPTNVSAGQFCTIVCIVDSRGEISNIIETCITVLELGSGRLQISLSWDNTADVDLWVTDPSGTRIYWDNTSSQTGGNLDRDDTDGYGPENIFWEDAPDGSYRVEVDHYSGATPARYIVTINGLGTSRQFTGTLSRPDQTDLITTIRKSGNSINF